MAAPVEIQRVISEVLAPLIAADGGTLYVVEATAAHVSLHVQGRFSGCPGNTLVARRVIEPAVRSAAPEARVTLTSGAILPPGAKPVARG